MRIISGKMKGSLLFMPPNKNTRPLKDIARESIFNLLIHSNKISFQIEKGEVAPFSGTLFNKEAAANILLRLETEKKRFETEKIIFLNLKFIKIPIFKII